MSHQPIDSDFLDTERLTTNSTLSGTYVSFTESAEYDPLAQQIKSKDSGSSHNNLTIPLMTAALVACLGSFQFGYHTGELNTPKDIFTSCLDGTINGVGIFSFLPSCIALTEFQFSVVTGMFPMGGIGGSVLGGSLMDSIGRRGSLIFSNILLFIGSLMMSLSGGFASLLFGRLLVGIAGGASLVVVPAYLAEITTLELRGLFGICNQFAIVFGIVVSQAIGVAYADITTWRFILSGGMVISLIQAFGFVYCPESPWYLISKSESYTKAEEILKFLRCRSDVDEEIAERASESPCESPKYGSIDSSAESQKKEVVTLTLSELFSSSKYRSALAMLLFLHLTQQMSGINAIMYYSTPILATTFGERAKVVTVLVNVSQLLFTFIAAQVIERWGRRSLIIISSSFMSAFLVLLAISLNSGYTNLSAITLFLSVGSYALGLGPLPFLLASEIFDSHSIGAASALGLATNLSFNFFIASTFLPISDLFPVSQPGSVFLIFAAWLIGSAVVFYRVLPETRASTAQANLAKLTSNFRSFFG